MAGFISKQPNGLYCRFSTIVDAPTDWNMTFNDYVKLIENRGKLRLEALEEARDIIESHLKPFQEVIDRFVPNNMTENEFNEWLTEVGYEIKEK